MDPLAGDNGNLYHPDRCRPPLRGRPNRNMRARRPGTGTSPLRKSPAFIRIQRLTSGHPERHRAVDAMGVSSAIRTIPLSIPLNTMPCSGNTAYQ